MEAQFVLAIVFFAATAGVYSLWSFAASFLAADVPIQADRRPTLLRLFAPQIDTCADTVESLFGARAKKVGEQIKVEINGNGLEDVLKPRDILGAQACLCLVMSFAAATLGFAGTQSAMIAGAATVFFGVFGWMYPRSWLRTRLKRRQEQISRALPYCIDLLTVAMRAGQDFGSALRNLVKQAPEGPLVIEFERLLKHISLGKSRAEALDDFAKRIALKEVQSLVSAVIQSQEMGSSVADTLQIQAEEIRNLRFHKAERKAARASSLMLMPMVLFILPATFIVIFTPIVLNMLDTLSQV